MSDQPSEGAPLTPGAPLPQGTPLPPLTPLTPGTPPAGTPEVAPPLPPPPADGSVPPPPPPPPSPAHQGAQIPTSPPPAYAGAPTGFPPPPPMMPPPGAVAYGSPPPAPPGMYWDQASGVPLPEGVVLASVGQRIGAWFLSLVLAVVTLGIGYIIWGAILWSKGSSPAFSVLGMRVWRPQDGRPASWGIMALRDIVGGLVEGVLFGIGGLVSFIMFLSNNDHKSLKDTIASTLIVHDPNKVLG